MRAIGRDTFCALARILGPEQKMDTSPSFTVHGGAHGTKYVTFEFLLGAAFVADEIGGYMHEPARDRSDNDISCTIR